MSKVIHALKQNGRVTFHSCKLASSGAHNVPLATILETLPQIAVEWEGCHQPQTGKSESGVGGVGKGREEGRIGEDRARRGWVDETGRRLYGPQQLYLDPLDPLNLDPLPGLEPSSQDHSELHH